MSVKPVLALTLTCLVWGFVLGCVHELTEPRIREAERREMATRLSEIFPGCEFVEENGIFLCYRENQLVGRALEVRGKGYGGEMRILVGINLDKTVRGVRVLSHSETKGIGSRAAELPYLSQFENLSLNQLAFRPEGKIEAVSGATVSSRAILEAVRRALEHA
ncbi:MAG: FMN-binding protein [Candidatus Hadarchaeales archaeon]